MQMNLLTRPGSDLSLPTGIKSLKIDPEFHKSSLILADQSGVLTRTIHILIAVLTYTGQIYTSCQIFLFSSSQNTVKPVLCEIVSHKKGGH